MPTGNNQFRLKLQPNFDYDISIDWGDGSKEIFRGLTPSVASDAGITHTYTAAGTYLVGITENSPGGMPKVFYDAVRDTSPNNDAIKIRAIRQWGRPRWQGFGFSYAGCTNLRITATDTATSQISGISNFNNAWNNCISIDNFPRIDASNGTNFNATWLNCRNIGNFPLLDMNRMNTGIDCFNGLTLDTQTYSSMLTSFGEFNLNTNVTFHAGSQSRYFPWAQAARDLLTRPISQGGRNWTITDGGSQYTLFLFKSGPNCATIFSNPAGINCNPSCSNTSANFTVNSTVTLDSTIPVGCQIYLFRTSRPVTYVYSGGTDLNFTGNGIMQTGDIMGTNDSLIVTNGGIGTPYLEGDGIKIQYRDLTTIMTSNISVTAFTTPTVPFV